MSEQTNNSIDNEFINIFAHDIKIPLSAVKGCLDLVEQLGELNDKQVHWLHRAMGSVTRMETIVHNLLDYSRLSEDVPLERAPFSIEKTLNSLMSMFEAQLSTKNIDIRVDIDSKLEDIVGDENLISHVLQNVLGNAIKYNDPDGKIWITVSDERAYVRVDVQDTGIGIAAEDLNKVFDKYYRGKKGDATIKGNGLGLSIARAIIEKHDGHIWVNSQLGTGSTFSFTIPRDSQHGMGNSATDSGIHRALKGFNISHRESAVEPMDDVDDDTQETMEQGEDSPQDEYQQ